MNKLTHGYFKTGEMSCLLIPENKTLEKENDLKLSFK